MDSVRERTPFHHINYAVHRGVLFLHNFREEGGGGQKSLNTYVPKQIKSRCAHTVFKKNTQFRYNNTFRNMARGRNHFNENG